MSQDYWTRAAQELGRLLAPEDDTPDKIHARLSQLASRGNGSPLTAPAAVFFLNMSKKEFGAVISEHFRPHAAGPVETARFH
jgi:hypothetical protein